MRHTHQAIQSLTLIMLLGCSSGDVFNIGENESKPPRQAGALDSGAAVAAGKPIFAADYNVSVDASNGQNLCKGVASVIVGPDLKFKPTGTLTCILVGQKNIADLFKDTEQEEPLDPTRYPEVGKFTRKPNPLAGTPGNSFEPPRPQLLGPLIQRPEEFSNYRYAEKATVTVLGAAGPQQDQGTFLIQVLDVATSFTPEGYGKSFDQIIHWELNASGFNSIQKGAAGIFDRAEYWQNVRPISIPQIKYTTKLSQLFAGGMSALGDAFLGPVTISIVLKTEQRF